MISKIADKCLIAALAGGLDAATGPVAVKRTVFACVVVARIASGEGLRTGVILQYDGRFFVDDAADPHVDQFAFRSARLDLAGTVLDAYAVHLMPDFAGGRVVVQDAYLDARVSPAVRLRFGKMKVPFGLERLQDEKATTFTERGLPTQLAPNRDLGVEVLGELAGVSYQLGVFNGVADGGSSDGDVSDDKELAARVVVQPFARGPGVGIAVTYGDQHGAADTPVFRTAGQTAFFQVAEGTIEDGRHWRATAQGDWYLGPIGVLAEYVRAREHVTLGTRHDLADFEAWQVLVQWVVTGEDATYRSVTPSRPSGAFDVAARLGEWRVVDADTLDRGFADPTTSARRAHSIGVGADWFANRSVRFVLDVDHTWYTRGAPAGDRPSELSIIGRAQLVY